VTSAALGVSGVSAPFGAGPGLQDVSFTVAPGERLVIVGGSGAGKTTLLRAIAGLGPIAGGRIAIAGHDVCGRPPERRDAVYLHQTPLLFPHLSVRENVAFPLRVRRVPAGDISPRVRDALAAVQLDGFADRAPRTLSGGQRHRVALARAVVARPAVLLLDEPFVALDPTLRDEVRTALLVLQRQYQPALVVVTHDLEEAGMLADRVGVLLQGRLAQLAPPGEVFAAPASLAVARFLGIPNMIPGVLDDDGAFDSAIGRLMLPAGHRTSHRGPRVAVFRPGAARLASGGPLSGTVVGIRQGPRSTAIQLEAGGLVLEVASGADKLPQPGAMVTWELDPSGCVLLDP
jgi:putative spermidine/putrescine transport system ATP-binding protein